MSDEEGAERARQNKSPMIYGRRANVDLAYIGAKTKSDMTKERVGESRNSLHCAQSSFLFSADNF